MSVSIAIILDTRRIKENNKYPVKLRVNFQRKTKYYQTIFVLSKADYNKLLAPRVSTDLQDIKNKFRKIEHKAEDIIKEAEPFAFLEFEKRFVTSNPLFRQRKRKQELTID